MKGFAALAANLRATRRTSGKVSLAAGYLAALDPESLPIAARFLSGRPFSAREERTLSVGGSAIHRTAKVLFPEIDDETLGDCFREVGDAGETFALLQRGRKRSADLPVREAAAFFERLAATRGVDPKLSLLAATLEPLAPEVLKEIVKLASGGQRTGLSTLLLEQAIAKAFSVPLPDVQRANLLAGDVGRVAALACDGRLSEAALALFHPMGFQLAAVYEAGDDLPWEKTVVEEKFDGIRAQAHVAPAGALSPGRVALFSRTLDEITGSFPEIAARLAALPVPLVADGEILAFENGRALPFGRLQKRLGRKKVDRRAIAEVPLVFVFYDLLAWEGALVIDLPFVERRRRLESLVLPQGTFLSPVSRASGAGDLEFLFDAAIAHGNEGLMIKDETAPYAPGKRGRSWLKYKKARATLDVVVTVAEPGHGRRAGLLSDLTFAVRAADGSLVNVGKAYSGLTDAEIAATTATFKRITEKMYGRTRIVRPEVVLEVAFDGIQESRRHKSGYALRFPRILRLRPDKPISEIDTVERVAELHEQLMSGAAPPNPLEEAR
ncbi:MAG TPA: ATP-dependent DNA ligase [Thermoanaerobaculia bacterium]|nr:ATP-dependent DNA ligase [Thermoanaerobaculia bacterium]